MRLGQQSELLFPFIAGQSEKGAYSMVDEYRISYTLCVGDGAEDRLFVENEEQSGQGSSWQTNVQGLLEVVRLASL